MSFAELMDDDMSYADPDGDIYESADGGSYDNSIDDKY